MPSTDAPRNNKKFIASVLLVAVSMAGIATLAWLTDYDSRDNRFLPTADGIGGIIEEVFVSDPTIVPGDEVQKEVKVTNTEWVDANGDGIRDANEIRRDFSGGDAWVVAKVSVPTGTVAGVAGTPYFELHGIKADGKWKQEDTYTENGNIVYVFSYADAVAANASTDNLFTSVMFHPDLTADEARAMPEEGLKITVESKTLQAANTTLALAIEESGWVKSSTSGE